MGEISIKMLKLTAEDEQELRKILVSAQGELVRALAGLAGCGYSSRGIDLCQRKWRLENLLDCLERAPRLRIVPQPSSRKSRLAIAA
jgi:hypothetical protein